MSVSVPSAQAETLRAMSDDANRTLGEIVVDAHLALRDDLVTEAAAEADRRGGLPVRRRRRRGGGPATQLGLYVSELEADQIKDTAERCRLSVSAYVAQLLARHLS